MLNFIQFTTNKLVQNNFRNLEKKIVFKLVSKDEYLTFDKNNKFIVKKT